MAVIVGQSREAEATGLASHGDVAQVGIVFLNDRKTSHFVFLRRNKVDTYQTVLCRQVAYNADAFIYHIFRDVQESLVVDECIGIAPCCLLSVLDGEGDVCFALTGNFLEVTGSECLLSSVAKWDVVAWSRIDTHIDDVIVSQTVQRVVCDFNLEGVGVAFYHMVDQLTTDVLITTG